MISQCWRDAWERVIPFLAFPPDAAPRGLHDQPDRERSTASSAKRSGPAATSPTDDAARKLLYLAIRNHESTWKRPMAGWYECLAAFHAHYGDRLTRQS